MRFSRVDHIGIAVEDFDEAVTQYTKLHGAEPQRLTEVAAEGVRVAFFRSGETQTELLAAMHDDSAIAKFIAKRGPGLHHICYAVDDMDVALADLQRDGFVPLRPASIGAEGRPVVFFHPKHASGVLIEVIAAHE